MDDLKYMVEDLEYLHYFETGALQENTETVRAVFNAIILKLSAIQPKQSIRLHD